MRMLDGGPSHPMCALGHAPWWGGARGRWGSRCGDVTAGGFAVQAGGEKLGKMIRNAEVAKVPVVCIVGPRDMESGVVSVRTFESGEQGQVPVDDFIARVETAIRNCTIF
jgi:Anticodon binding domain